MVGNFDFVIIGAGIMGLALARAMIIKNPNAKIGVFDKEPHLGTHASGRNSGVIHAGVYYQAGTLKAKLCQSGAGLMRDFCQEHNIPINIGGKVIVATSPDK